jgi:hypothetical protein
MTPKTTQDETRSELDERLSLFANAWMMSAVAKSGPAISHWEDKVDEHRRAIRELFASSPSSTTATPATGCLTPSDCEYASQGWCPRCEKPALPSSRALSEEERKALDWVIRDIEPTTLYEIDECNADEASAMYAVANTLRGLRDRLTGAPK